MSASMISGSQLTRLRSLLQRVQHLETVASTSSLASSSIRAPTTRADAFLSRAKALEAKVGRLELIDALGENYREVVDLEKRLDLLEKNVVKLDPFRYASANVNRVALALRELDMPGVIDFLRVPNASEYYTVLSLEERAALLGAPSPAHLCKTLLFSTSGGRFDNDDDNNKETTNTAMVAQEDDSTDQFLLLVVPYDSKVDASKLRAALRANKLLVNAKKSPCVASPGRAERVLGFPHNGVCVVGGSSPSSRQIPIVFAEAITKLDPPVIYMGGGEPDVKLCIRDVRAFIDSARSLVLDVTEPRVDALSASSTTTKSVSSTTNESILSTTTKSVSSTTTTAVKRPAQQQGKNEESDEESPSKKPPPAGPVDFDDLDVRVGCILQARRHPNSEKLMCEEIDLGEATGPRAIVSGIQSYYSPEDLTGHRVCVVVNLKAATLGGEKSNGMVLCASWKEHDKTNVKIVLPPPNAPVGSRITAASSLPVKEPATSTAVKKKKIFESVAEKLCIHTDGTTVVYDGQPVGVIDASSSQTTTTMNYCTVPNAKVGASVT